MMVSVEIVGLGVRGAGGIVMAGIEAYIHHRGKRLRLHNDDDTGILHHQARYVKVGSAKTRGNKWD